MLSVTDEQCEELFRYWIDVLRLQQWDLTITLLDEAEYVLHEGNQSNAKVKISHTKFMADVFINAASEDPIDYLIVHELVHVMMSELEQKVNIFAENGKFHNDFHDVFDDELEKLTHIIARAIVEAHGKPAPKKGKK